MIKSHLPLERVFESSWFPKFPTQREKNPTSRVQILINPASRVAFKFRFPSRYFASFRIPHRSLVKSRIPKIPFETLPAPLIITFELVSQSCDCCVIVNLWSGKFAPPPRPPTPPPKKKIPRSAPDWDNIYISNNNGTAKNCFPRYEEKHPGASQISKKKITKKNNVFWSQMTT